MSDAKTPPEAARQASGRARRQGRLYAAADRASGALILFLVVATAWVFGTTYEWSIWAATGVALALGALLGAKKAILRTSPVRPPRWDDTPAKGAHWLSVLAILNFLTLAYIAVSGWNARAVYDGQSHRFDYREAIAWLPLSYDRHSTWFVFWQAAGLTCVFWAVRDWLLGKTAAETARGEEKAPLLPIRLRRLLWVLSLNGGLIAIEAILQRLEGSGRVLFLVVPRFNNTAEAQFGPWAYRGNAAEYLNLVWPVTIGFWFWMATAAERRVPRSSRMGADARLLLLPTAILTAASVFMSSSRGGALVAVFLALGSVVLLLASPGRASHKTRWTGILLLGAALGLGAYLGWDALKPRLAQMMQGDTSNRDVIYGNAWRMAHDFFLFGSGPGTFDPLYQLYRGPQDVWESYAHNDWLEFLITFGVVGRSLLLLVLSFALGRYFRGGGLRAPGLFYAFVALSLAGCLVNAVVDFPFRIYSCCFLFILLCSIAATLGRRGSSVRT